MTIRPPRPPPSRCPIANSLTAGQPAHARTVDASSALAVLVRPRSSACSPSAAARLQLGRRARRRRRALHPVVWLFSMLVEGRRRAMDRLVTALVTGAVPARDDPARLARDHRLTSGLARFDADFFTDVDAQRRSARAAARCTRSSARCSSPGSAALISIPIGLLTAIYLVEYGRGRLARGITFLVDVMTGIPSIVAGLFAYALFVDLLRPRHPLGIAGAVALSVLMIPVVVRSSEEMLKLVPTSCARRPTPSACRSGSRS